MGNVLDWSQNREMWIRVLVKQTGEGLEYWNLCVRKENFEDKESLRAWLKQQGVTGYAENLLVMERYGYPDFMTASVGKLVDNRCADRSHLRPIYEAIMSALMGLGGVTIQMRKTYV